MLASVGDSLKIWSWTESDSDIKMLHSYRAAVPQLYCIGWNHTNLVLAAAGKEAKVHLLHASNGQLLASLPLSDSKLSVRINTVAFSHNSRYLATSLGSPIQLWDLKTRQIKSVFTGHQSNIVSIEFISNGNFYAADESGSIKLWSQKSVDPVSEIVSDSEAEKLMHPLSCFAVSPLSSLLVSGYDDGSVRIWDSVNPSTETPLHKMQTHAERIMSVSCSKRNPRLIATASMDEYIHLLDINAPSKFLCSSISVEQKVTAVSFHEDGIHCAAGTSSGSILLYDWRNTSEPVAVVNAHDPYPVYSLAFQNAAKSKEGGSSLSVTSSAASLRPDSSSLAMMPMPPPASTTTATSIFSNIRTALVSEGPVEELMPIRPPRSPLTNRIDSSALFSKNTASFAKLSEPIASTIENEDEVLREDMPQFASFRSNIPSGLTSAADSFAMPLNLGEYSKVVAPTAGTLNMSNMPNSARGAKRYSFMHMDIDGGEQSHNASMAQAPAVDDRGVKDLSSKPSAMSMSRDNTASLGVKAASFTTTTYPVPAASSAEEKTGGPTVSKAFEAEYTNRVRSYVEIGQDKTHRQQEEVHYNAHRDPVAIAMEKVDQEFAALKDSIRPVTHAELEEVIEMLKYDIHEEVQQIIREQVRQFSIARVRDEIGTIVCALTYNSFFCYRMKQQS